MDSSFWTFLEITHHSILELQKILVLWEALPKVPNSKEDTFVRYIKAPYIFMDNVIPRSYGNKLLDLLSPP